MSTLTVTNTQERIHASQNTTYSFPNIHLALSAKEASNSPRPAFLSILHTDITTQRARLTKALPSRELKHNLKHHQQKLFGSTSTSISSSTSISTSTSTSTSLNKRSGFQELSTTFKNLKHPNSFPFLSALVLTST